MLNTDGRHDAIQEFRDAFEFDHLQEGLPRIVAALFHDSANQLLALLPDGPALTRSIHDLWRGKNEAVRFAVRVRTQGVGGQPPATFRGANPVHETAPVHRTIVRAQDRHPDHQTGRPDGPAMARVDWFTSTTPAEPTTMGGADRVLQPDDEDRPVTYQWPDHDEDNPDTSAGRHTATDAVEVTTYGDLARGERRFIDGAPTFGVTFVNDSGPDDTRSITNPPD